jgi:hypothetical protein
MRKRSKEERDDLRPEYELRELLKKGVLGKYARRYREGSNLILLEPEVAKSFRNSQAVNEALRLVIELGKLSGLRKNYPAKA